MGNYGIILYLTKERAHLTVYSLVMADSYDVAVLSSALWLLCASAIISDHKTWITM